MSDMSKNNEELECYRYYLKVYGQFSMKGF